MIPWIQVYSNLTTHPKTTKLAEELKLSSSFTSPTIIAAGLLVGIWTWAIQNAYNGDLSSCSPSVIADACRWKKKPEQLIAALKKSGYMDPDMRLHDWEEYAVLIMDSEDNRREKTRDRVKRYREKKRSENVTECNSYGNGYTSAECNVTDTPYNAPTGQDITGHNRTKSISGGDTRTHTRASKNNPVDLYMDKYDVSVERYFDSESVKTEVTQLTQQLFSRFAGRQPTQADEAQVFRAVTTAEQDPAGTWQRRIDKDAQGLLIHAFRLSAESGKAGDWKYITGILKRFSLRGIKSVDEAEDYQAERDVAKLGGDHE